jgi:formamidopyrimidine-DNA glycosylase
MPELPEVEVLAQYLRPLLRGKTIQDVTVRRSKVLRPTPPREFRRILAGATFTGLARRGKYLRFQLQGRHAGQPVTLLGHLGMTGRMFLADKRERLPTHAAVVFDLGRQNFIYEDTRYFGRLTLDDSALDKLGPEPLSRDFQPVKFARVLKRSRQAIKVKLLDQAVVAGIGNIYASEALFRARLSPEREANRLTPEQVQRLWRAVRRVLAEAIRCGSTVPLNFGADGRDEFFYFGRSPDTPDFYEERLRVYDREGRPCPNCRRLIRRITQGARSTFYCAHCQRT